MSCSECSKVSDMLHAVMDGEASCDEIKEFKEHLENCAKCAEHVEEEKILFSEIKAKMESKCCPQNVLSSVLDKIKNIGKK